MRRRRHTALALIGAILLLVLTMGVPQAGAQAGGSKQVISGQTVTWSAEWTQDPETSIADENVELLALSNTTSIVGYGGTAFPAPANQVRDIMLEGVATEGSIQQIERGDYDNVSYSIDLATSEGFPLALFTLVIENPANTTLALLITTPDRFGKELTAAQAGITIDGAPIFDGVDAARMQATIDAAIPATAPASTPATGQNGGLGDLSTAIAGTPTPAADEQSGSTLPGTVTVASSGVEVRYSDDWSVQRQEDVSLSLGTAGPPVVLITVIDLGSVSGSADAATLASGLLQQVSSLNDAEIVAALNPSPDRIVIVFRDPDASGTLYRIYDIALDQTATTAVTVIVGEGDLDAGVALVRDSIQVGGEPVMTDLPQLVPEIFGGS